jgi:hypothetical protein
VNQRCSALDKLSGQPVIRACRRAGAVSMSGTFWATTTVAIVALWLVFDCKSDFAKAIREKNIRMLSFRAIVTTLVAAAATLLVLASFLSN